MSEPRYPNESQEYRDARDALLKDEQELVDKVKAVAEKRRKLPPGGRTEGGLRLPVGQRRQGRTAREILRAVRRQEHAAALLVDVRPELGQAVSVLHVADGWVRPHLVFGRARRRVRRHRQGAGREDQRLGEGARLVADPAPVRIRVAVSGGLQVPGRERRHAAAGDACLHASATARFSISGAPRR